MLTIKTMHKAWALIFIFSWSSLALSQSTKPEPLMTKLIYKNFLDIQFDYPQQAIDNRQEGSVSLYFSTDKNGQVIRYDFTSTVSKQLDSTALHLFKMIIWQPATNYGLPVEGEQQFELDFKLKKFEKLAKTRGYKHIVYPYLPVDTSFKIFTAKQLDKQPYAILDSQFTSLPEFVYQQLDFPEAAINLHISGIVTLLFVIETNGLPSNIFVKEAVGGGCTEEAIRIMEMIRWFPGIKDNMAVRTNYEMFIKFVPPDEGKPGYIPSQSNRGL